jgi:hypothetical protein
MGISFYVKYNIRNPGRRENSEVGSIVNRDGSHKKNRRTNITLSIPAVVLRHLRIECSSPNISLNQKVNDILVRWLFCHRAIGLSGGIVIPSESWKDVLEKIDEDYLLNSLDTSGKIVASILSQNDIPMTLDNFVKFILYRTVVFSGSVSHFHHYRNESDDMILTFEHSFGIKWSRILGKSVCRFLNSQLDTATDLVASDRNVKIVAHTDYLSSL